MSTSSSEGRYKCLVYIQSLAFFLLFAAFNTAQSLATSLPAPAGLAPFQFAALYLVFTLLCIPAPKLVASLGPKMSMILGGLPYAGIVLSFLAPPPCLDDGSNADHCWGDSSLWALKITMGALVGVGAPFIWTGQGVYLARLASHATAAAEDAARGPGRSSLNSASGLEDGSGHSNRKALLAGSGDAASRRERLGARNKSFNGIFFSAFQFSGATGNLVASLILTFLGGNNAVAVLFWALSACCVLSLIVMTFLLPRLGAPVRAGADANADGDADGGADADSEATIWQTLQLCFSDARMYMLVPNIVYNGMSLGFIWSIYTGLGWNTVLGASFVGFGSAFFYLVNTFSTGLTARLSGKIGQMPTMVIATAAQAVFYLIFIIYQVRPASCLAAGCQQGVNSTSGPCFSVLGRQSESKLPVGCHGAACAVCQPYDAANNQQCSQDLHQCQWLHGDMAAPAAGDVAILFIGAALFAIGDSVWEGQVPAVLQTLFDGKSGNQPAAMANLKLWQSLGIAIMFGLGYLDDVRLCCIILLASLGASSLALLNAHTRVASFDSGNRIGAGTSSGDKI